MGRRSFVTWASVVVFTALTVSTAAVWEPVHDEGVTWEQAIGPGRLPTAPQLAARFGGEVPLVETRTVYSVSEVIANLVGDEVGMHPPLYYLLLRAWSRAFGTGRLALVLPALLLGAAAIPAFGVVVGRLVPLVGAGAWGMLLLAVSPWVVGHVVWLRPYGMVLAVMILATASLLRAMDRKRGGFTAFVTLSVVGLLSLYHYALVVLWQLSWWGAVAFTMRGPRGRAQKTQAGLAAALILAGFSPWLPALQHHLMVTRGPGYYFSGLPSPHDWPAWALSLLPSFALGEALRSRWAATLVAGFLALCAASLPLLWKSFRRVATASGDRVAAMGWRTVWIPLGALLVADLVQGTHTLFLTKTSFFLLPVLLTLLIRAWFGASSVATRRLGLGLWTSLLLAASVAVVVSDARTVTPMEALAHRLAETDGADHLVVVSSRLQGYAVPLLLEMRRAGVRDLRILHAPASRLRRTAETALADGRWCRITLVNLGVLYDPTQIWRGALLGQVAALVRPRPGWRLEAVGPADADEASPGCVLSMTPAIPVKYYPP